MIIRYLEILQRAKAIFPKARVLLQFFVTQDFKTPSPPPSKNPVTSGEETP